MTSKLKFQKWPILEFWNFNGQTFESTLGYFFLMTHLWNLYIRYEHELNYHQHKTEFKNINQELRYKGGQSYMTWHITLTTKFFFCFFDSSQALMYVHHNVKEFFKNSHRKVLFLLRSMLYDPADNFDHPKNCTFWLEIWHTCSYGDVDDSPIAQKPNKIFLGTHLTLPK